MLKRNIRILVSFFCIVSSCALLIAFLFINNSNNTGVDTVVKVDNKARETVSDKVKLETVSKKAEVNEDTDIEDTSNVQDESQVIEEVVENPIVYDGMTLDELASKLDRSFKNELSGKGHLYAYYSLEKGVDPYLAAAISLEETGCNWNCSNLVKSCNNVGGMKGSGCGAYGYFNTLDDGIRAFIDNIARNYVAYGLTTADLMNPKYAENPAWSNNVNNYITRIKNN